ncbi:N utilization substance protein B [Helicobacter sp. 12S02634-8]|uniref:transcription antitermination factor NusB n=1 Tax=Helicobacter sp. 12S02634-8 TaxID=1476199 RepID=UPI000BA5DF67|nr:transcription antitermination factor NusB [Helicobacter sp. 12S02634-8]PAF47494.1 N utilization substance protein B [Helicobacter sp. 12S02634-8]
MATRTQAREAIIGLLYAYDSGNTEIKSFAKSILEEKKIKNKQQEFALGLFDGVLDHLKALDDALKEHLKDWDFERLGGMERAILRLGAYEILYTATDAPVIINEAVELGKAYGGDNAPKFINGVLDALSKIPKIPNSYSKFSKNSLQG